MSHQARQQSWTLSRELMLGRQDPMNWKRSSVPGGTKTVASQITPYPPQTWEFHALRRSPRSDSKVSGNVLRNAKVR